MDMKTILLLASALSLITASASVDEIDLETADDTAENAEQRPQVRSDAKSDDGYIDISCDDATISSVLKQFRKATQVNIISGDSTNLQRRVSASLNHVRWDEALQSILKLANFKMEDRGGVWYVSEKTKEEALSATRHYLIHHASAQDLADLFNGRELVTTYAQRNSLEAEKENKTDKGKELTNNYSEKEQKSLVGDVQATAFPSTNVLILKGTETDLNACEKIIAQLDRPVTQVYIEARFIELSNEAKHKLGVQWDQLESWGASVKGLKAGYETSHGKAADYGLKVTQKTSTKNDSENLTKSGTSSSSTSTSSDGSSSANASGNDNDNSTSTRTTTENSTLTGLVPSSIAEAAGAGASAASMGWKNASTFSGQLSADDFRLALSAFEQIEDWKMFSNPRIIVSNGKSAKVDMTKKEPNVEVTSDRSGSEGQYLSVSTKLETIPGTDRNLFAGEAFFSYGISLSVKPRVSAAGLISVEVVPSISEKADEKTVSGSDSAYTTYPIINMKSISTEFTMKDGATAVIGGLTRTEEEDIDSGIPYLRNIPWIGPKLFGWKSRQKVQTEIIICVTVGIANPETLSKDAGLPKNAVLGREYIEGRLLEPGDRPNAAQNLMRIDTRSLEDMKADPYWKNESKVDLEADDKKETK